MINDISALTGGGSLLLAATLVSWWKPLAVLGVFLVWAWLVSSGDGHPHARPRGAQVRAVPDLARLIDELLLLDVAPRHGVGGGLVTEHVVHAREGEELGRELGARGGFVDLDKSLKLGRPEVRVVPDREKAAALGVEEVVSEVLPEGKVRQVEALRDGGGRVAMVGDGVNDAPALAASDVGVAVGAGTDVAMDAADVILLSDGLSPVGRLVRISRETSRTIHQNLFFALVYNVVLVPLAAVGVVHPALAAAAMSLSSITVVTNSLRLRWRMDSADPVRGGAGV